MRAAVFREGRIAVKTVPDPVPESGQVLVRTLCRGIRGCDPHAAKHTKQFVDLARRAGGRWSLNPARGVVMGREFCCEAVDHGPGTPKRPKPGALFWYATATLRGTEVVGIGYNNDMPGGFARFMPLADRLPVAVPNGLPAAHAALTEPLAVGVHAVRNARLTKDDVPLASGRGAVGLSVVAALKIEGAHPIIAADDAPARRALAARMGADVVVDPAAVSPYEAWSDTATPDAPIAGTVGLDGVAGAFADLAHPKRHAKVMVDPWS